MEVAGRIIDTVRGTSMSEVQVPHSKQRSTSTGSLYFQLFLVILISLNGHHIFLDAYFLSFQSMPLNESIGLTVRKDPETGEFAHPAGLVVATPDGVISRYLFGLEPSPRDLRMALVESSAGTLGGLADQVLLYCFAYDPEGGQYTRIALLGLRGAALGTLGIAGTLIGGAIWRERRRNRRRPV